MKPYCLFCAKQVLFISFPPFVRIVYLKDQSESFQTIPERQISVSRRTNNKTRQEDEAVPSHTGRHCEHIGRRRGLVRSSLLS